MGKMIKKIRDFFKFYIIGSVTSIFKGIGFTILRSIEFTRAYKSINKFLKQYKDRALMIRVTTAQGQLLIACTQIGILNLDDLCKATGAMITKDKKILYYGPRSRNQTILVPGGRRAGKSFRAYLDAKHLIESGKCKLYIDGKMACIPLARYNKLAKLEMIRLGRELSKIREPEND